MADSSYLCCKCLKTALPFNYIIDECEYSNVISNFFCDVPISNLFSLNAQQLSILNNNGLINNEDIQAYKLLDVSNKYYAPDEIKPALISKFQMENNISILHINAQSLAPKLRKLNMLLAQIGHDFDIIAVSETWESDFNFDLILIPFPGM